MNIQSISIVVPTKGCVNKCKFCVSRMHENPYENSFDEIQIRKRIKFAANNGVNTMILTGTGEALQNIKFLEKLKIVLDKEHHPFPNVEIQTTGVLLMNSENFMEESGKNIEIYPNIILLKSLGVNTVSLSISDIFNSDNNWNIIGAPGKQRPSIIELCQFIKENGFNLRLSLNMTNTYNNSLPDSILRSCKYLGADQITFRKLFHENDQSEQTKWVKAFASREEILPEIQSYITSNGKALYRLPFGPMAYSIMGMSTVIDDNCMNKDSIDSLKYVILRENGKLYCQWDDEGSLIF